MTVSVNGVEIPEQAIAAELQHHPAGSLEQARDEAARALVLRELLLQEARRLGVKGEPRTLQSGASEDHEEATIRALLEREVRTPEPEEAELRRWHARNAGRLRSSDIYEAAHILFAAGPRDEAARARARARAETAIAHLRSEPGAFARLARELSDCPSAAQGGALGQVTRGRIAPELETFLQHLAPGEVCPTPVPSRYGYHVLRLDRRSEGATPEFELVKEKLAAALRARTSEVAVRQFLRLLVGRSRIEGLDLAGSETPLLQ